MPVKKFRGVEELNQPIWHRSGDPALFRAIAAVWNLDGGHIHARFHQASWNW